MLRLHMLFWFQNRVTAFGGRERHYSLPILAVIKQMFSDFYFTLPCLGAILFVQLWPEQRQQTVPFPPKHDRHYDKLCI